MSRVPRPSTCSERAEGSRLQVVSQATARWVGSEPVRARRRVPFHPGNVCCDAVKFLPSPPLGSKRRPLGDWFKQQGQARWERPTDIPHRRRTGQKSGPLAAARRSLLSRVRGGILRVRKTYLKRAPKPGFRGLFGGAGSRTKIGSFLNFQFSLPYLP